MVGEGYGASMVANGIRPHRHKLLQEWNMLCGICSIYGTDVERHCECCMYARIGYARHIFMLYIHMSRKSSLNVELPKARKSALICKLTLPWYVSLNILCGIWEKHNNHAL